MTEQIIETKTEQAPAPAKKKQPRQLVRFSFYKLDIAWLRQPEETRLRGRQELEEIIAEYGEKTVMRAFSLYGLRTDCDLLIWQAAYDVDDLQGLNSRIRRSQIGPYLIETQSLLSMTKRSIYVGKNARGAHDPRLVIEPDDKKYLFVYPFVKTRAWYALPMEDRKRMMAEHIRVGLQYPHIKLNTTYSYGIDDQEFVVAFESDVVDDFLDLVQELRDTEASMYTLRDTPMYICVAKPLGEILEALGA